MKVSILSIGTELLMGRTINTNAAYLSEKLNDLGYSVMYHLVVGDNKKRLLDSLDYLLTLSDIVITTGGLGPTADDITKDAVVEHLNLKTELDQKAYDMMLERFNNLKIDMPKSNIKQVMMPVGQKVLYNHYGTAPGYIIKHNEKYIISLPGVPYEMKYMFEEVENFLKNVDNHYILSEYINLYGIGESSAEELIEDLVINQINPTIAMYAGKGTVSIRVTASGADEKLCKNLLSKKVKELTERLQNYISYIGSESITEHVINKMKKNNLSLSSAESCTGGMVSSAIITYPGVSKIYDMGFTTYSNNSKMKLLNVKKETLDTYGAVSYETCKEMLDGVYQNSLSDICVATTGIAGPGGGTEDKPVGLVYLGVLYKDKYYIEKCHFRGDRTKIRESSVHKLMNMVNNALTN